jgi:hypothetical protein
MTGAIGRGVAAALPDFALAVVFLLTWIDPFRFGPHMVGNLMLTMLLEFIIVHSSGFMGAAYFSKAPRSKRIMTIFGLGLLYTLFVGGFSLSFHSAWPLASFWGLTCNRMLAVLLTPTPEENPGLYLGANWAMSAVFYLFGVFLTVIAPVPRFGITAERIPQLGLTGGGLWIDQPYRVLAFGVVYFMAQGIWNLWLPFLARGRSQGALSSVAG